MRKIFLRGKILLTAITAGIMAFPSPVFAVDFTLTASDLENMGVAVSGNVVIPETVEYQGETVTVTGIGQGAFANNTDITGVTIPDTVSYIGYCAFSGCSNLQYVNLPENLQTIEEGAFELCSSLTDIDFPDSVTELGNFTMNHCSGYTGSFVTLPSSLETLGASNKYITHMFYNFGTDAFQEFRIDEGNKNFIADNGILYTADGMLASIPRGKEMTVYEMPDWVTRLGELSFSRNLYIDKVILSDNLVVTPETSDTLRFYNCHGNNLAIAEYGYTDVNEYEVKPTNTRYSSQNGILYSKGMDKLVAVPTHYNGVIDIPEGVVSWQKDALWGNQFEYGFPSEVLSGVTEIRIPASMSDIPDEQVGTVNDMVRLYGTKVTVAEGNKAFRTTSRGNLVKAGTDIRYTTCRLNMRSEPDGDIIKTADPGTPVIVKGRRDGWAQTADGYWCSENYLEKG